MLALSAAALASTGASTSVHPALAPALGVAVAAIGVAGAALAALAALASLAAARLDRLRGKLWRLPQLRRRHLGLRSQRRWAFAGSLHHDRPQRFRAGCCPHEQRRLRLHVCRRRRLHRLRDPDP